MGTKMDIGRPDHLENYYRKVIRKDNNEISLDADMIRLLIAIDENKSLYQINGRGHFEQKLVEATGTGTYKAREKRSSGSG
jgi:hypothetical protein